jgi:hypothetical protein
MNPASPVIGTGAAQDPRESLDAHAQMGSLDR